MLSSDERGVTLVELLVAMMLGTIVLGALFSLVTATGTATGRTTDRVDAAQRGRTALEASVQQLRSSVCLPGNVRPWVDATDKSVTWYANLDDQPYESVANPTGPTTADPDFNGDPSYDPRQRRLTYDEPTSTLTEEYWSGPVPVPAGNPPTRTRVLLTDLAPVPGATGIFTYGAYSDVPGKVLADFVPGDLSRIVRVEMAFVANPASGNRDARISTSLSNSVYARVVNRNTGTAMPLPTYGCTS